MLHRFTCLGLSSDGSNILDRLYLDHFAVANRVTNTWDTHDRRIANHGDLLLAIHLAEFLDLCGDTLIAHFGLYDDRIADRLQITRVLSGICLLRCISKQSWTRDG